MIAIMCETPFQLLNALNIVYTKYKEDCIIFITEEMFETSKKFKINCENNSFIKGIYKVERKMPEFNFWERVISKLFRTILHYDYIKLRKKIPEFKDFKSIDRIICIKYSDCAFDICKMLKRKKKIEINIIEEGIGEYVLENGVLFESKDNRYVKKIFLISPELYNIPLNVPIEKSPNLNSSPEFKKILDNIYQYKKENKEFRDVIYFEQAFSKDYNIPEVNKIEKMIFDKIIKNVDKEKVVVKLHPRNEDKLDNDLKIINTLSPWECSANDLENIENKVLISISSTAIITPKLFCDKEPYVICTIKIYEKYMKNIFKEYNYYDNLVEFLESVQNTYKSHDKFFMPNNIEEFEEILVKMKGENIL